MRAATAPLPSGWVCLRNSNISGLLSQPVEIHYVLLHPDVGMALLDVAPAVTPDAEAILRQRLAAVRFEAIFQGYLPIVYRSILPGEVSSIDEILAEAFAALPPLTLAGGDAWVTVLQRALSPRNPVRAAAPSASPGPPPALRARPPQAEPAPVPAREEPPPRRAASVEAAPPRASEPADMPEPAGDAEAEAEASSAPRRPRPGIWLAAGLGAAVAISALAVVLSGGDRPAATAEEAVPPAPAAVAVAPLPDPLPSQPGTDTGTAAEAAPAIPLVAGVPPDPGTPPRNDAPPAAPAPAEAPPVVAAMPLPPPPQPAPPPPATPAPVRGGAEEASPPPPAPPAAGNQEALPRVAVRTPANMRKGPGNSYAVLRVTRRGEVFQVHGYAVGGWVEVGDDQPQGWIHSSLLTELTP